MESYLHKNFDRNKPNLYLSQCSNDAVSSVMIFSRNEKSKEKFSCDTRVIKLEPEERYKSGYDKNECNEFVEISAKNIEADISTFKELYKDQIQYLKEKFGEDNVSVIFGMFRYLETGD